MTFTHVADAPDDDDWNKEELGEIWDENDLSVPEEDEDDLWLEEPEEP